MEGGPTKDFLADLADELEGNKIVSVTKNLARGGLATLVVTNAQGLTKKVRLFCDLGPWVMSSIVSKTNDSFEKFTTIQDLMETLEEECDRYSYSHDGKDPIMQALETEIGFVLEGKKYIISLENLELEDHSLKSYFYDFKNREHLATLLPIMGGSTPMFIEDWGGLEKAVKSLND